MSDEKRGKIFHQLLAVEGDLGGECRRVQEEAIKTFGRPERFTGHTKTLRMLDEARVAEEESGFDHSEIATTVDEKLKYLWESTVRYFDAFIQKEATNQTAKADIIIEGEVVASGVPATALLGFETKLNALRRVYESIPTLPPGIAWDQHPERSDVFNAKNPEIKNRTEKVMIPVELSPATKEHKAQVDKVTRDVVIGVFTITNSSGMVTPTRKSALIGRVDSLIRAVKAARMAANMAPVVEREIGKKFLDFIHAS